MAKDCGYHVDSNDAIRISSLALYLVPNSIDHKFLHEVYIHIITYWDSFEVAFSDAVFLFTGKSSCYILYTFREANGGGLQLSLCF